MSIELTASATRLEHELTEPIYRLSVEQYQAMINNRILTSDDRVELLDAWIIPKMTKNPPHVLATARLFDHLVQLVPAGWFVAKEDPVVVGSSQPEPDIAVIRGDRSTFRNRHPNVSEVEFIVEVADTSLALDLGKKKRIYAQAKVPEYWVLDVEGETIELFREPVGEEYSSHRLFSIADTVPVSLGGTEVGTIPVRELLI